MDTYAFVKASSQDEAELLAENTVSIWNIKDKHLDLSYEVQYVSLLGKEVCCIFFSAYEFIFKHLVYRGLLHNLSVKYKLSVINKLRSL